MNRRSFRHRHIICFGQRELNYCRCIVNFQCIRIVISLADFMFYNLITCLANAVTAVQCSADQTETERQQSSVEQTRHETAA